MKSLGTSGFDIKRRLATILLLLASLVFSLFLAEGILRLLFEPVDYLAPYMMADKILRHRVEPHSGGHDSWGFRNRSVPSQADIVAIGDSLTYGVSASAAYSWPAVLQRNAHKTVYDLALGGYGPVDYSYLLESKAVLLKPSAVIVGFYFGNDLRDAFNMTYRREYWKHLRTPEFEPEADEPDNRSVPDTSIFLGSLRFYLAHHSILYRSVMLSFGETLRFLEMKYGNAPAVEAAIFEMPELGIRTGFTPVATLSALNLNHPEVREGMRISLELFLQMKRLCAGKGIEFYVLLLPTKENVFARYIDREEMHDENQIAIHELVCNEHEAGTAMKSFFDKNDIRYIDALEPLREAVGKQAIYPANQDGHPNKNGYEIIANTVLAEMKP